MTRLPSKLWVAVQQPPKRRAVRLGDARRRVARLHAVQARQQARHWQRNAVVRLQIVGPANVWVGRQDVVNRHASNLRT